MLLCFAKEPLLLRAMRCGLCGVEGWEPMICLEGCWVWGEEMSRWDYG